MDTLIDVLTERGFIETTTSEDLKEALTHPKKIYCGFDPTADSLHLGNLVGIMGLAWFQQFGHTPYILLGGATGMIGDPSGKTSERQLLSEETIKNNLLGLRKNFETILDFTSPTNAALFLNNYDWFKNIPFTTFLRDIGKHFRLGPMLAKDSVKGRMGSEEGMSFTEFSYQVLQGYDFLYLLENYGVTIQIGGSDQWGNITAGTELIRKVNGQQVFGLTFPLLTRSDGQKFGKSEKGAIWLSPEKLSPYEFYQYLVKVSDLDVIKMMKILTFMNINDINAFEASMKRADYIPNTAQKRLAQEVTRMVHGEEPLRVALEVTKAAAPGAQTELNVATLEALAKDMPSRALKKEEIIGVKFIDFLCQTALQRSKGEARKLIRNGGIYINNHRISDEYYVLSSEDLMEEKMMLLSFGKKSKVLIRLLK